MITNMITTKHFKWNFYFFTIEGTYTITKTIDIDSNRTKRKTKISLTINGRKII